MSAMADRSEAYEIGSFGLAQEDGNVFLDARDIANHVTTCQEREFLMQRFCVTAVKQGGRQYFVANYPANRKPWSRKAAGRAQKKFNRRELAEAFLEQAKREWVRKGGVNLAYDQEAHYDFMRAMEVIKEVQGGTLELAAHVFLQCRSLKEKRGGKYEVAVDRRVELSPRIFLMVQNEAVARKVTISQAAEGLLSEVALSRAEQAVRRQIHSEEREYRELKKRNDIEHQRLQELAREARIREEFGGQQLMYERGRQSVLGRKAEYMRRWRERKKELVAKEKES
jgi:hypothetical protein